MEEGKGNVMGKLLENILGVQDVTSTHSFVLLLELVSTWFMTVAGLHVK